MIMIPYLILVLDNLILGVMSQVIPPSPFKTTCPSRAGPYLVDKFRGTPYVLNPFKDTYINPVTKTYSNKVCREDGHCMFTYEINIVDVQLRVFDRVIPSCASQPGTWFLTYDGVVPGPTIIAPTGHESMIRFNNKFTTQYFKQRYDPCIGARNGRPISVHFHGSASLAPYDGWAEDETCVGETKDYVYPNNRPTTGWYHDHALHITADNAYFGMAGAYVISSKKKDGGCGEPWNLENVEEKIMILNDKVLDNKCQLMIDVFNNHKNNLYGDINLVSGVPFPNMPLEGKWYRFRFLNAAVSRPYLLKWKLENGVGSASNVVDVGHLMCYVIATDGGYRTTPVTFPEAGLLIGVAERYEVVCDFSKYGGKTIYLWNDRHPTAMKDVPYFCYSHLLARVSVSNQKSLSTGTDGTSGFNQNVDNINFNIVSRVLTSDDILMASAMVSSGGYHRKMVFGRSNGHWAINGETWDTYKIAADDVGQNTWELWLFETGGGWFHPIHMHLVDFYILQRENNVDGLRFYERESPKDVLYLGPGEKMWVIARFGAHKGDYMFHCHNLIHEDNDMMRAMHIMDSGKNSGQSSAQQYILNPLFKIIYNNWKYADPMLGETSAKPSSTVSQYSLTYANEMLNKNLYRIFYPLPSDEKLQEGYINPWKSQWCKV
jgi:FtsP/CotA-like multicopper oxidase with cupredoxin domain